MKGRTQEVCPQLATSGVWRLALAHLQTGCMTLGRPSLDPLPWSGWRSLRAPVPIPRRGLEGRILFPYTQECHPAWGKTETLTQPPRHTSWLQSPIYSPKAATRQVQSPQVCTQSPLQAGRRTPLSPRCQASLPHEALEAGPSSARPGSTIRGPLRAAVCSALRRGTQTGSAEASLADSSNVKAHLQAISEGETVRKVKIPKEGTCADKRSPKIASGWEQQGKNKDRQEQTPAAQ